jgi:hypothetical protein
MDGTKLIKKKSFYIVGYLFEHDVKFGTFFTIFKKTFGDIKSTIV